MIRLSPQQRIVAWRLALQPLVLRSELTAALWDADDGGPLNTDNIIKIRISQLRKLLPGIVIKTHWGFGYSVPDCQRDKLLSLLAAEIEHSVIERPLTFSQYIKEAA